MTASPLLPPGTPRRVAEAGAEATAAELSRMTELALRRGAHTIAIGRGRCHAANRVGGGVAPPPLTPPDMRVRIRRFVRPLG